MTIESIQRKLVSKLETCVPLTLDERSSQMVYGLTIIPDWDFLKAQIVTALGHYIIIRNKGSEFELYTDIDNHRVYLLFCLEAPSVMVTISPLEV